MSDEAASKTKGQEPPKQTPRVTKTTVHQVLHVVGMKYHDAFDYEELWSVGCKLDFRRQPWENGNQSDPHAIAVYTRPTKSHPSGITLGFVPKHGAAILSPMIDAGHLKISRATVLKVSTTFRPCVDVKADLEFVNVTDDDMKKFLREINASDGYY